MRARRLNWMYYAACVFAVLFVGIVTSDARGQMDWGDRTQEYSYSSPSGGWDSNGWLGSTGVCKGWQLGATGDNTDAGVAIRQVLPNSPAARANIFPGDVIVCVAGDQVGRVGNQIFDLQDEVRHHADSSGRVQMLVYFRRQGQLRPLFVQLQDQAAGLVGSLAVQGGRIPADAIVTVRLENVSRPYYAIRNGEYSFRLASFGVGDIPFQLNYDPAYISASDSYQVRAFVTSGGRTVFDTTRPVPVLTRGNPTSARLVLQPVPVSYPLVNDGQFVTVSYNPIDTNQQAIIAAYRRYLNRMPSSMEMAAWYHTSNLNDRVGQLPLELMATDEYFNRVGGNNAIWMQRVFAEIVGHQPSSTEMNLWMRRFAELGYSRTELLRQLRMQAPR